MNTAYVQDALRVAIRTESKHDQYFEIPFIEPTVRYMMPMQILVAPDRQQAFIVARTPHPVPADLLPVATAMADEVHDLPKVAVNGQTGHLVVASVAEMVDVLDEPDTLWELTELVIERMLATVYKIDLLAQGVEREVVSEFREFDLALEEYPLLRFRPFVRRRRPRSAQ